MAEAEGYFARENLAVTLRMTRAEPGAAEALAQGQADLAATPWTRSAIRTARRQPVRAARLWPHRGAACRPRGARQPDQPREIDRELPGTRVGSATPGAPEQAWFAWLLAKWGLSVADVWIVSHGARGLASAMETGDVPPALMHEPQATRLLGGSEALMLADLRTPGAVKDALGALTVTLPSSCVLTAGSPIRSCRRFARAVLRRRAPHCRGHAAGARRPARQECDRPADDFETRLAATRGVYLMNGLVSAEQLQETLSLIRAHQPMAATARLPRRRTCCTWLRCGARHRGPR